MAQGKALYWRRRGRWAGLGILLVSAISVNGDAFALIPSEPVEIPTQTAQTMDTQSLAQRHLDQAVAALISGENEGALRIIGADGPVWVSRVSRDGAHLTGIAEIRAGTDNLETMIFHRDQILDWSINGSDGRLYGNFGTRTLLGDGVAFLTKSPIPKEWAGPVHFSLATPYG